MKIYFVFLLIFILNEVISTIHADALKAYRNTRKKCIKQSRDSHISAIVVNSCPRNYTGHSLVKKKCRSANVDFSDPVMSNSLTDISTRMTFQNIYCAECNNVYFERMAFWKIVLYCESLPHGVNASFMWGNLKYRSGINKWGVMIEGQFHQCDLSFEKPDYLNVRQCRVKPSISCPPAWHRNAVNKACSSCMNSASNHPLRNYHCLICNSEPDTVRICNHGNISIGKTSEKKEKKLEWSFPLLVDIDLSDGNVVGKIAINKCSFREVYDPFANICREIVCGIPGYELLNGKCAKL